MDILCRAGRHIRSLETPVWNHGYWFSSCRRCGCDLVRRGGGRWRAPPKGYKVVWRPRVPGQVDWNGLIAMRPERPPDTLPLLEALSGNGPEPATPAEAAAAQVEEPEAEPLSA